jgi:hypothetical protein
MNKIPEIAYKNSIPLMRYLEKAVKDRYLIVNHQTQQVTYLPHQKTRDLSKPEEQVQLATYLKLIYRHGYPAGQIKVCERVQMGSSSREADIVVYRDEACKDPYLVVECKKRNVSQGVFNSAIEQGFSYAAVTHASYLWVTSGDRNAVFEVNYQALQERDSNRLSSVPNYLADKRWGYGLKKRLRWFVRHPIMSDSLVYATVLLTCALTLSKLSVVFFPEIYENTRSLWQAHGMDFNWIYNAIVILTSLLGLLFGGLFMRSHQLFSFSPSRKGVSYALIALILFIPSWYIGISNEDPLWWSWQHYQNIQFKTKIYLWPYLKAFPFQVMALYGLIWILSRRS